MNDKPKLVSLLSNWYSGATLLTILLNAHSRVVSNGESMLFDEQDTGRYDCSCGKYVDECEFYKIITSHMRARDDTSWDKSLFVQVPTYSRKPLLRSLLHSPRWEGALRHRVIDFVPGYRRARDRFLDAQLQFFAGATRLAGASIYLDGTKSIRRAQLIARDGRCDMKVLHLIRDGRGFCASYVKHKRPVPSWTDAAKAWVSYISQVDQFSRIFPSIPVLVVKYEDLCRSTEGAIRAVCRFLEIPYEKPRTDLMQDAHILGNRMRRTFTGVVIEDTSWKEALDGETLARLNSLMKPQLVRFGYL